MRSRLLILVLLALAVSGCVSERKHELLAADPAAPPPAGVAAKHEIFVATTRQKGRRTSASCSTASVPTMLAFARVGMTVPKDHEIGRIERAKDGNPGDPAKDFTATDLTIYDSGAAFTTAVADQGDRVLVFIHGYNTGFDDGVYRLTQIAHDTQLSRHAGSFLLGVGRQDPRLCLRQG